MKDEGATFTVADLTGFMAELVDHERLVLADRLERASERLAALAGRIDQDRPGDGGWSGHEVLAHIAVFSKFYGMLTYKVGSGQLTAIDLLGNMRQRDVLGAQAATRPPDELLRGIAADHRRTAEYLRSADAAAMQRTLDIGHGLSLTADHIARHILIAHLEQHLDQIESAEARP
jgi:hypothetical protein